MIILKTELPELKQDLHNLIIRYPIQNVDHKDIMRSFVNTATEFSKINSATKKYGATTLSTTTLSIMTFSMMINKMRHSA